MQVIAKYLLILWLVWLCCLQAGAQALPVQSPTQNRFSPLDPTRHTQPVESDDWLTFGHDQQRTGWNHADKILTPERVSHLELLWSAQLPVTPNPYAAQTLTTPVVVSGVKTSGGTKTLAFTISGDNILFAIDADRGQLVWQKSYANLDLPLHDATWMCTNTEQATPVIDKENNIIYFTTSDGKLRGVSLDDGNEKLTPAQIVPPDSRNWSLNLVDDWVYTSSAVAAVATPPSPWCPAM
jgi:glucose dehydrogenase